MLKKTTPKVSQPPNPYALAIFTAVLSGILAVIGSVYTADFQAKQALLQKQFEYRVIAYTAFLDKIDNSKMPALSQMLNLGAMVAHLGTDADFQMFEDRVADLLKKNHSYDVYLQLNSDLNVLRMHGSMQVAEICDDLLKSLLLNDSQINWSKYPPEVLKIHDHWNNSQKTGSNYGVTERITSDERMMIVMTSKLTQILIKQLRNEMLDTSIQGSTTTKTNFKEQK